MAHDRAVARISHLPHVLAATIVALQNAGSLDLAGTGFLDTTRIASGDAAMWREILLTNRTAVLAALDTADDQIMRLRDLIDLADGPGIERYLEKAKTRRDALVARRLRRAE